MGDEIEGNFREKWLPSCTHSRLEYLQLRSVHKPLLQFILVRDYLNAECIKAATGFTPLLVNFESMTAKPRAGGGSRDCYYAF